MSIEPPFSHDAGPAALAPNAIRMVSREIERYYPDGEEPQRSDIDQDFWILGMADEDVPPFYCLPKPHAVYTLSCRQINAKTAKERAAKYGIDLPNGFLMAYYLQGGIPDYAGYTSNPYRRMDEHFCRFTKAAEFTTIFPPERLVNIEWFDTKDKALEAEQRRANRLSQTGSFINPSLY